VTAGRRDLQRAPRDLLTANVGQIRAGGRQERGRCERGRLLGGDLQRLDDLAQMADRNDGAIAAHDGRLGRILARHEEPGDGVGARVGSHGQHAAHRAYATVEGQLADE
jgi:hypothetical protein